MAAVDQLLIPESDEDFSHGRHVLGIEREALPAPIAGAADDLELLDDRRTGFPDVLPGSLYECFPTQVEARLAFGGEALLDHVLRRDPGMVGPGQPLGSAAAHPLEANQHILDDVVERVPDVQHVGDVGRGDDDDVRLAIGPRLEDAGLEPALVDHRFYGPRIVCHSLI